MKTFVGTFALAAALLCGAATHAADYSKRALQLDETVKAKLLGRWTNPVDNLVIEIRSLDLVTGEIRGVEWPTIPLRPDSSPAGTEHDVIGWVGGAAANANLDNVLPVSFSTSLFEYGTLPVWAGYLKDGKIVTMHYLVWPNRTYPWDHISSFQETWTKIP
jgi:hypothetical protein